MEQIILTITADVRFSENIYHFIYFFYKIGDK